MFHSYSYFSWKVYESEGIYTDGFLVLLTSFQQDQTKDY